MNALRKWIRDVFGFSGNEINGFLILLPIMVVLIISEPLYRYLIASERRDDPEAAVRLDSLIAAWEAHGGDSSGAKLRRTTFFNFDPNTASVGALESLGFSAHLARRIAAYREKGGVFRAKSDLLKIYAMDSSLYKQLYEYIRVPSRHFVRTPPERGLSISEPGLSQKRSPIKDFDINTADTTTLKTIYGIGSVLAKRIVRFREALGGFVKEEQFYEVYGLDSTVVGRLMRNSFIHPGFTPSQININLADEKTLSRHPYIGRRMASLLASYRFQHGDYLGPNDIKKLSGLKTAEVERLLPYLTVTE